MNCPSRTDEPEDTGFNQSPSSLSKDLATRNDLNGLATSRVLKRIPSLNIDGDMEPLPDDGVERKKGRGVQVTRTFSVFEQQAKSHVGEASGKTEISPLEGGDGRGNGRGQRAKDSFSRGLEKTMKGIKIYAKFVGPGFMISVAYIDPGNYSTDVAAGATYRFKLLFIVLMSNVFAVFLQSLCIKLGSVSGLNLAQACREFLPRWLNIFLYLMAETAIIATDIAEVIGTAIAINLLIPKIPLVAGCALSIIDVLLILLFYKPDGSMKGLRAFEMFVVALVLGVVICFCIQLSLIKDTSVREVFRGYLPSSAIMQSEGLYQACGILGATVMPHSLYLGSGIVQSRLEEYDIKNNIISRTVIENQNQNSSRSNKPPYYPSLPAINFCLKCSIIELSTSLFTFALFVNSAILIVAGASLSSDSSAASASLFGIYDLLSSSISKAAGTIFALALLLSGISAGFICTIAGQMVSEGALYWTMTPWLRRLVTRSISITPSIIIAGAVGREGLSAALNGSQVALSVILPFVSAPLIYFTCRNKYMTVKSPSERARDEARRMSVNAEAPGMNGTEVEGVKMKNHWITAAIAVVIWLIMTVMNVANLVLLGKGQRA